MTANLTLVVTAGVLVAAGVYLLLERSLTRILLGILLASNGVNLLFLVAAGRPSSPPIVGLTDADISDPLPQAMVLTAIVITLGVTAFVMALAYRAWQLFGHDEVPDDVRFMTVWSNPPIRVGKNELHAMLLRWLPRLEPGSDAWLVVQRNLGSDSLQRWMQGEFPDDFAFLRAATSKGYRVLRCRRRSGSTEAIDVVPQ